MKKVTIISSSLRKNSNSEILANEFIKGAKENGNEINLINLKDIKMQFCIGCLSCGKTHKCVLKDGVTKKMIDEICGSDVIVFVTPVYYYAVSGQLKTFIDRMNPIYSMDYKFKDIYVISTAAEDEVRTFKGIKEDIKGFVDCYEGTKVKGTLFAGGLEKPNDAKKDKELLKKAYEMGRKIK